MDAQIENKIKQVAQEYIEKGYEVFLEPRGKDIPKFLKGYRPDIIAKSTDENLVIEIKERSKIDESDELKNMADLISNHKDWKFELIVISLKEKSERNIKSKEVFKIMELERSLNEIDILINRTELRAAFTVTWAYFESLGRQVLISEGKDLTNKSPLSLIKTLFSFGYLSRRDLESLEKLYLLRNKIVHGYADFKLSNKTIKTLITIMQSILLEYKKHFGER